MSTLKESMQMLLDKMDEVNFTISRNNEHVGESVGIVVNKRYISLIRSSTDIVAGDTLTDRNGTAFVIAKVSVADGITQAYFSETG